jgi:hypothetical protein
MPEALTHTRITRALSPTAPQVPGVTPGSPCAHGVSGTPHGKVCNTSLPSVHKMLIIFIIFSYQEQRDLKSGLITLHMRSLGPQKLIKLGRIEGFIAHELGQCSARPQAMYKVALISPLATLRSSRNTMLGGERELSYTNIPLIHSHKNLTSYRFVAGSSNDLEPTYSWSLKLFRCQINPKKSNLWSAYLFMAFMLDE